MKFLHLLLIPVIVGISTTHSQESASQFEPASLVLEHEELEKEANEIYKLSIRTIDKSFTSKQKAILSEYYEDRKDAFVEMLHAGRLIMDGSLLNYVQKLCDDVVAAAGISKVIKVYLVRDETPNAFNMGDDKLFINIGLLYRSQNRDQLAFVLAHELGHNELRHGYLKTTEYAELVVNDSIQKRMRQISNSRYRQVTELNKLMIPWILGNKERSRTFEEQADEFGYEILSKGNFEVKRAVSVFDVIENGDHEVRTDPFSLKNLLYLEDNKLNYQKALTPKVASSLGEFEKVKDTLDDLLRTHPFSVDRKQMFIKRLDAYDSAAITVDDTNYTQIRMWAEIEIIRNAVYRNEVDRAISYMLLAHEEGRNETTNQFMPLSFSYLGWAKLNRRAGKLLNTPSDDKDDSYNELIHFLTEISPEQCFEIAETWNRKFNGGANNENTQLSEAIVDFIKKDTENFDLIYQKNKERVDSYPIISILDAIKNI